MLALIVALFNIIGGLLNFIFLTSFSIGKVMFMFCRQAVNLLFSLISNIATSLRTLFEEFQIFWTDLTNCVNKFSLSISEGATDTVRNIQQGTNALKEKTILYATRELGIKDLIVDCANTINYIFNLTCGGLSLLSDILWFILMLVPNCVIFLASVVLTVLRTTVSVISLCCSTITTLVIEIYSLTVYRVKSRPIRTTVEVIILLLLITNSVFITINLKRYIRYIYRRIVALIRELCNSPYLRLQSRRLRQRAPQNNYNRTPPIPPRRSIIESRARINATSARNSSKTTSEKDDVDNETNLCVICQERQRCIVLFPCKHLCLCDECSYHLQSYQNTCPLCRIYINNQLKIYV